MNLLGFLLISIVCSYGMAVLLVEKRWTWPVRPINLWLRWHLRKLHPLMKKMPQCSVCTSFWTPIVADAVLLCVSKGRYWMWPLSGFATAGFTWFVYELLAAVEKIKVVESKEE